MGEEIKQFSMNPGSADTNPEVQRQSIDLAADVNPEAVIEEEAKKTDGRSELQKEYDKATSDEERARIQHDITMLDIIASS